MNAKAANAKWPSSSSPALMHGERNEITVFAQFDLLSQVLAEEAFEELLKAAYT